MVVELQAHAALLVSALVPIWLAAHDFPTPKWVKKRQEKEKTTEADEEEDDDEPELERLTSADAWMLPVLGSGVLLTLYLAFKYLDPVWINRLFRFYFTGLGVAGLTRTVARPIRRLLPTKWHLTLKRSNKAVLDLRFTTAHIVSATLAVAITLYHHVKGHWMIANALALSFAFNAISLLRLDSFMTGAISLGGLFFYDIFWVFGTQKMGQPVMETVARTFDAPIKVVWPRDLSRLSSGFALLGLGDIVLPGLFVALSLRFDYMRALEKDRTSVIKPGDSYPRPYFYSCFAAYVAGLVTTILVMHAFQAAQPALLYLSPACVGSVMLCAAARGESKEMWSFVDEMESGKREKEESKKE